MNELNQNIFDSFPTLETKRLWLRELKDEDATGILAMRANKRVREFIARPEMTDIEVASELTTKAKNAFYEKRGIAWAGEIKTSPSPPVVCLKAITFAFILSGAVV